MFATEIKTLPPQELDACATMITTLKLLHVYCAHQMIQIQEETLKEGVFVNNKWSILLLQRCARPVIKLVLLPDTMVLDLVFACKIIN